MTGSKILASGIERKNQTYRDAARVLRVSTGFVCMLVKAQRKPGLDTARRLFSEYGVPFDAKWPIRRVAGSKPRNSSHRSQ